MIGKSRFSMMTGTFLMVFVLSAMWAVPVFADDSTPPPVEIPTEVAPPVDADIVIEPVVVYETSGLDQLPEGTEVNVVGENGEALPLATQKAAEVIVEGDPIWCPVGVTPKSNTGGCSQAYTSFQDLIDDLKFAGGVTNPAKAGVIWIEGSYDSSGLLNDPGVTSFILNGDDLTNMRKYALTIKGGWSGAVNTAIDQNNPSTFTGASLSIINWLADVTISDIEIVDAVSNTNTCTENTFALEVETTKNIKLERVTVEGSINAGGDSMTGAKLNNASSTTSSTVTVNNGIFEDNEGDGLLVQSAGIVTITSLFADGNDASGAVIDNTFNTIPKNTDKAVTLKGSLEFNNNGNSGLTVISKGLITISNVIATENGEDGVNLNNTASLTNLGVTVGGTNSFIANSIGLNILSHGAIKANNINASKNGGTGVILDNCHKTENPDPAGFCRTLIAKTVTLTGYNYFNDNNNGGLSILSFGGITVSNLNASGNTTTGGNYGVTLDNQRTNFAIVQADSIGTVVITGYGIFNNNDAGGLLVLSHGNVTLTNLTANDNGVGGVYVWAEKNNVGSKIYVANVTITGVNYFAINEGDGLYIKADGKISVANINASQNTDDGAELRNLNATDLGYGIVLSGTNNFVDNSDKGLVIDAKGSITVSNVTSLYNKTGASLNNQFDNLKRYNITLSGTNSFNFNDSDGLLVDSYGVITTTNLTANGNGIIDSSGNGVTLDNCNNSGPGVCIAVTPVAVTLNGYVNTSNNFYRGLQIDSLGAITLSNVIANGNGNVGVRIDNKTNPLTNKTIVRGVTLKGVNIFNGNYSTGLFIKSYGAITLNSINASYNGDNTSGSGSGAYLENHFDRTPLTSEAAIIAKNITMTGVNSFIGNYTFGLKFNSNGIVTLTRISANGNDWDTENFDTGGGVSGSAKSITLTCGHMYGNGAGLGAHDLAPGYDLQVGLLAAGAAPAVKGVLTIKGIYSSGNNGLDARTLLAGSTLTPIVQSCALP